jgi:hypothetical protein
MVGLALVGVWLMVLVTFTLFGRRTISIPHAQYNIIRFISAIVGGIAGFLFAYDLKVDVLGNYDSNLRLAVTSGGSAAVFVLVFLLYPKLGDEPVSVAPPTISMDIPSSWTFEQAVLGIAKVAQCTADCNAFSDKDRRVKLASEAHIVASDMNAALLQLKKFLPARLKSYSIRKDVGLNHYSVSP